MPLSQVPDRKVKRQKLDFGFQESSHCIRNGCRAVDIQKMACQIQGLKCSGMYRCCAAIGRIGQDTLSPSSLSSLG